MYDEMDQPRLMIWHENNIDNLTELILGASPNMVTFLITILIKNHGYIYKYIRGFKFAIKKQQNLNC